MPNWVHNVLTVHGPADILRAFADQVRGTPYGHDAEQPLDFAAIVPEPDGLYDRPDTDFAQVSELLRWRALRAALNAGRVLESRREEVTAIVADQPVPDEQLDAVEWHTLKWGTKWNANFDGPCAAIGRGEAQVSPPAGLLPTVGAGEIQYAFLTAWSPPTPVIIAAARQWPQLTFTLRWAEPGSDAAGEVRAVGDQITISDLEVAAILAPEDQWF